MISKWVKDVTIFALSAHWEDGEVEGEAQLLAKSEAKGYLIRQESISRWQTDTRGKLMRGKRREFETASGGRVGMLPATVALRSILKFFCKGPIDGFRVVCEERIHELWSWSGLEGNIERR